MMNSISNKTEYELVCNNNNRNESFSATKIYNTNDSFKLFIWSNYCEIEFKLSRFISIKDY